MTISEKVAAFMKQHGIDPENKQPVLKPLSETGTLLDFTDSKKEYQLLNILMIEPHLCDTYRINPAILSTQPRRDILRVITDNADGEISNYRVLVNFMGKLGYSDLDVHNEWIAIQEGGYIPSWYWDTILNDLNELHSRRITVTVAQKLVSRAYSGESSDFSALLDGIEKIEKSRDNGKDFCTAEEIGRMSFPPINFLIADILPPGLCFLAGRPKAGKSWLALQIAYAVARGKQVIGKQARSGNVIIYALEDNLRRLNWRMSQQGWDCDRLTGIKFKMPEGFTDLQTASRDIAGCDLMIIDTFTRATGSDQVDPVAMRAVLSPLQKAAIANDKTILVIDHMPKGKSGRDTYSNVIYDLYGSISKAGIADSILGLYRDDEGSGGKLSGTGRDIEDFEIDLIWDKDCFQWQSVAPGTVIDRLGYSDNRHAVLSAIVEAGDISQLDLASVTGMNKGTISRVINELVESGYVLKYVEGKRILYQPSVTGRVDILPQWDGRSEKAGAILQGALIP